MKDRTELIVGHFYWVMPDSDLDGNEEWEHDVQPARFAGLNEKGNQLWHCLNLEGSSDWPMRFIGNEIIPVYPEFSGPFRHDALSLT